MSRASFSFRKAGRAMSLRQTCMWDSLAQVRALVLGSGRLLGPCSKPQSSSLALGITLPLPLSGEGDQGAP